MSGLGRSVRCKTRGGVKGRLDRLLWDRLQGQLWAILEDRLDARLWRLP